MSTAVQRRRGTTAEHSTRALLLGELSVDTDKKTIVVHDGTTLGGFPLARQPSLATKSANYSAVVADIGKVLLLNGAVTLSFAAAAGLGNGWNCSVRNIGSAVATLDPNAAELIDGSATVSLLPGQSCMIFCDGTAFYTIGRQNVLTTKLSASNQASLIIPIPDGYTSHEIVIHRLRPVSDAQLDLLLSVNGGSSYLSSYQYNWEVCNSAASPSSSLGGATADTRIQLTGTQKAGSVSMVSGTIQLTNASGVIVQRRAAFKVAYSDGAGVMWRLDGTAEAPSTSAVTHVKLQHTNPAVTNIDLADVTLRSMV